MSHAALKTFCLFESDEFKIVFNILEVTEIYRFSMHVILLSTVELLSIGSPGGTLRYREGPHPRYVSRGRRGLFLRPPHVCDFVKEGYFFVVFLGQNPLTIHEIYAALTPSDSRSDWASEFAAATCCQ